MSRSIPILAALLAMMPLGPAVCATATATIAVSATVQATCVVSALPLAFGNYTGALTTATTTISVTCTNSTPYDVGLGLGNGAGATVTNRLMTFSASTLGYGLYSNSGYSTPWGPTTGTDTVGGTGNGTAQTFTVYGQIPANQYPAPGSYTDTVTVIVKY